MRAVTGGGARKLPACLRALEAPRYRSYFSAQAVSLLGSWVQNVAMSWLAYRLTGSTMLLGLTAFLALAPQLLVSPLAGHLADLFDRRRLFVMVQAVLTGLALLLAALAALGWMQPWLLMILAGAFGLANAFDAPLRQTLLVHLVDDRSDLSNAVALSASLVHSARLIGPPLAGLILSTTSETVCFALNAASYLRVAMVVSTLPPSDGEAAGRPGRSLQEGLDFVWSERPVRWLLAGVAALNLTGSSYLVLMPALVGTLFDGDARILGALLGTAGAGALAGSALVASCSNLSGLFRLIAAGWVAAAAGLALLTFAGTLALALASDFTLGVGVSLVNISSNAILQSLTPNALRGRTMSLFTASRFGMDAVGGLLAGLLAAMYGERAAITLSAVLVGVAMPIMTARAAAIAKAAAGLADEEGRRARQASGKQRQE